MRACVSINSYLIGLPNRSDLKNFFFPTLITQLQNLQTGQDGGDIFRYCDQKLPPMLKRIRRSFRNEEKKDRKEVESKKSKKKATTDDELNQTKSSSVDTSRLNGGDLIISGRFEMSII